MPERLAVGVKEHIISAWSETMAIRIARHVSNILAPATISLPFLFNESNFFAV